MRIWSFLLPATSYITDNSHIKLIWMTELSLSLQSSRISYQPHCDPTNQLNASNNKLDDDITQDDDDCYQEARMSLNVQVINA